MGKIISGFQGGWTTYVSKAATLVGAQTNYNCATGMAGLFSAPRERIVIRATTTFTLRLNVNTNDAMTVKAVLKTFDTGTSYEAEFDSAGLISNITNAFITSAAGISLEILAVGD